MNREIKFVQINSGDFSVGGSDTSSSFSNILPFTIVLDNSKEYEVALFDIQYQSLQSGVAPFRNVCVNTNLVESTQSGSKSTNYIYTINWNQIWNKSYPATTEPGYNINNTATYITTFNNRKWYPLATTGISRISVSLTFEDNGALIPVGLVGKTFTSCSFGIREII